VTDIYCGEELGTNKIIRYLQDLPQTARPILTFLIYKHVYQVILSGIHFAREETNEIYRDPQLFESTILTKGLSMPRYKTEIFRRSCYGIVRRYLNV
jgi:hypothetical protein